jgi:hypothetical protein
MRRGAFEIEAVAGFQTVMLLAVQPDFKVAAEHVEKFLAFVSVGLTAAAAGFDAEKMRFHGGISPGEELHANVGRRLQDFSLIGPHEARIIAGSLEERQDVGAIEASDAAQRGDGRAHLAAFEGAEETDGDAGGLGDLREGEAAAGAQAAETLAGMRPRFRRGGNDSLALENVNDGGGIETASAAQKNGPSQQAHVGFGIEAVAALGALRRDEAEGFDGDRAGLILWINSFCLTRMPAFSKFAGL